MFKKKMKDFELFFALQKKKFCYSNFLKSSNYIEAGPKESKVAEEYQM